MKIENRKKYLFFKNKLKHLKVSVPTRLRLEWAVQKQLLHPKNIYSTSPNIKFFYMQPTSITVFQ